MSLDKSVLISRNKAFVAGVIDLIESLPKSMANDVFSRQLIRCSSSVGANYRAACRAKSSADFVYKLKIVEEEADEALYFLDLINYVQKGKKENQIKKLMTEGEELLSIYVASINTMKKKVKNQKVKKS